MHHEFIDFPCDLGSRSSAPGRVVFDHENLKRVANTLFKKHENVKLLSRYLEKSKGMSYFGILKAAQIPLQSMQIQYSLRTMHFFWPKVHGIESWVIVYTLPKKKCNFPRSVSFETECTLAIEYQPSFIMTMLWFWGKHFSYNTERKRSTVADVRISIRGSPLYRQQPLDHWGTGIVPIRYTILWTFT